MVRERLLDSDESVKLRLIGKRGKDGRTYNLPVVSEVAALIVGDVDENICDRDIIVEHRTGKLKRIHEMHPMYLPLQYPLLYVYGEDGYMDDICFSGSVTGSKRGMRVILPSSHTGGARYIIQSYHDAMAICKWDGYPNFTCNPKWPEILRFVENMGLKYEDRPDVVTRIFKMKINSMIKDFCRNKVFGDVVAAKNKKHPVPADVDQIISAEIPDSELDPDYFKLVCEFMVHGPCGVARRDSPCMSEVAWRLYGFEIQYRDPAVERLSFHLPDEQFVVYDESTGLDDVMARRSVNESMFLGWFEANKKYPYARELLYSDFPNKFVWRAANREWTPRKQGFVIGRLRFIPVGSGELYYLRLLLNIIPGATCYEDLRNVNGSLYGTYRDACYALGLLEDDKEYINGIIEASYWASAFALRRLFVTLLSSDSICRSEVVWNSCWSLLSDDILFTQRRVLRHPDLLLTEVDIRNYALIEIEKALLKVGRSLREFQSMSFPLEEYFEACQNKLVMEELSYDRENLARDHAVGEIVLNVASSGIASLLLPGGRTTHSWFKIPINVTEDSFCSLDRSLRDLRRCTNQRNSYLPFGGITVVFGSDFRQILPVIPKGSRQDVVNDIGDGVAGDCTDGYGKVVIRRDLLLECTTDPLQCIVSSTYPTFGQNVEDSSYLENWAILAPTLEVVEMVNQYMMSHNCSQEHTYLSADSVVGSDSRPGLFEEVHTPELLNGVRCSGLPNHELHLKIGTPVMLLRNIDYDSGLCNGTRLIITRLGSHVLEAKVLGGRCTWNLGVVT
ncbi:uncharacterized protein LOC125189482 [Salvia hispanica]|uniref:uncharacterized protein LOC125189482 n=1 Tax=Salvia hispanica TaxID=49212 RepID=UPI0020093D44|nr:uncharacterized protein LOC125189482 [Salvia hispanica]